MLDEAKNSGKELRMKLEKQRNEEIEEKEREIREILEEI